MCDIQQWSGVHGRCLAPIPFQRQGSGGAAIQAYCARKAGTTDEIKPIVGTPTNSPLC